MKIKGFTLAEVLITMAILGVVAALTVPALNTNANENANIAKYKKTMAALNNIGSMAASNSKIDFSSVDTGAPTDANRGDDAEGELQEQIWAILDRYGNIDQRATASGRNPGGGCTGAVGVVYFKDGTALCYNDAESGTNGFLRRITGVIDINGTKAPNTLSTCDDADCDTGKRILDQFSITLAEDVAFPGIAEVDEIHVSPDYDVPTTDDFAAIWAFRN